MTKAHPHPHRHLLYTHFLGRWPFPIGSALRCQTRSSLHLPDLHSHHICWFTFPLHLLVDSMLVVMWVNRSCGAALTWSAVDSWQASSSHNQSSLGSCFWLWDECRDPLRAGAENVMDAKSMFQITDHPENDYQPSCVHQFCTDVFIFTSCLLKVLLEQLLSTACSLSIKTEHLFQCLKSLATNESAHKFEAFLRTNMSAFHTFLRPI